MAKVVTPRMLVKRSVLRPGSLESRVISLWCQVKQGVHFPTWFAFTQPVANRFKLKSIRVWFDPLQEGAGDQVNYAFLIGTGEPPSPAAIIQWDPLLPVHHERNIRKVWSQTEHSDPQQWSMNTVYEGQLLRFGVWLETSGTVMVVQMFTSFEISEG